MLAFGWVLVVFGVWVTYTGFEGLNPFTTLVNIIKNPGSAATIIASGKKPLTASNAPSNASNASAVDGSTPTTQAGSAVVNYARQQIGKPYRFGGAGPSAFDCSGLTMMAYKQVGVTLPHLVSGQYVIGRKISRKTDLLPGDLLFPNFPTHVQIYSGNGNIIEAPKEGVPVRERSMWGFSGDNVRATRPYVK